jgi:hypothetical protein
LSGELNDDNISLSIDDTFSSDSLEGRLFSYKSSECPLNTFVSMDDSYFYYFCSSSGDVSTSGRVYSSISSLLLAA